MGRKRHYSSDSSSTYSDTSDDSSDSCYNNKSKALKHVKHSSNSKHKRDDSHSRRHHHHHHHRSHRHHNQHHRHYEHQHGETSDLSLIHNKVRIKIKNKSPDNFHLTRKSHTSSKNKRTHDNDKSSHRKRNYRTKHDSSEDSSDDSSSDDNYATTKTKSKKRVAKNVSTHSISTESRKSKTSGSHAKKSDQNFSSTKDITITGNQDDDDDKSNKKATSSSKTSTNKHSNRKHGKNCSTYHNNVKNNLTRSGGDLNVTCKEVQEDHKLNIVRASEKIEQAMLKRRQRIEEWRKDRKPKSIKDPLDDIAPNDDNNDEDPVKDNGDKWILDEENEEESTKVKDDECVEKGQIKESDVVEIKEIEEKSRENLVSIENKNATAEEKIEDEEIDPLDEYMSIISQQIKTLNEGDVKIRNSEQSNHIDVNSSSSSLPPPHSTVNSKSANTTKAVIVRTTVAERKQIHKGDIMEQNADALEYSSEEYSDDEDIFVYKKSKADCINTDHNKIYYRKFQKRFYNEVPEIANLTKEEVDQLRQDMDNIQITGKKCPKPIKSWAQCITYLSILDLLKRYGMHKPTPIQAQALPIIATGRDMLGIAKTGSGKTLAFLLPMFRHIKAQPPLEQDDGPIAIIITPTRELAMQIAKECRRFSKNMDLRVVAVYGGTGISEQIADLKRGTEIVVCTPGRMIDMLAANNGKVTNLRRATYVVIDEADRMFDMGFEPQVNKILECIRPDRQTVMFSATFPKQMEALARRALRKPIEVVVGGRSVVCESVDQQVFMLNDDQKYLKLLELLGIYHEHGSVLVFVHKQEHADELMKNLMHSSYPCLALHGGIDQYDRDSVISDFKSGVVRLLIATSVAARGIDVKDIILVVNYDCPNHYEDYVHRCGRTGRAGRDGVAVTFITPNQEKQAGDVIKALELSNREVNSELRQLWDNYKTKMAAQGVQIKSGVGGFGGKGFKFDNEEQAFLDDRKRVQKLMFGMQDSDDEDGVDIDNEIDKTLKSKTRIKTPGEEMGFLSSTGSAIDSSSIVTQSDDNRHTNVEKLAFAKLLAAKIGHNKAEIKDILTQSSMTKLDNNIVSNAVTGKSIAEQIAGKLNNKLNYVPKERDGNQDQEDIKVYEEELEINDFPQNARWKITSKETLGHIAEYAEAAVTVRGKYFPPGKPPPQGESRLYLIIEALTERGLQLAKAEIKRIIKEEMMKMQNPALQMVNRGRYKVM